MLAFLSVFFFGNQAIKAQVKKSLEIEISNFSSDQGMAELALYQKDNFLTEKPSKKCSAAVKNGKAKCFFLVEEGSYAIALFQDLNLNKKIDKNFFGAPKEPYAFSNNVKPIIRAPRFEECKFEVNENSEISIAFK